MNVSLEHREVPGEVSPIGCSREQRSFVLWVHHFATSSLAHAAPRRDLSKSIYSKHRGKADLSV